MVPSPDFRFRPATSADLPLLAAALLANLNAVRPTVTANTLETDPRFRHYVADFAGPHDFGVVAETPTGEPLGVAWARLSTHSDPAPGYLGDDTPEVLITVFEGQRGLGIGYELLIEIEKLAIGRGFTRLSLWVEDGNRSRRLYERRGYRPAEGAIDTRTMVKKL
ncbi:MAG: GNAT family N-acetyltransferase [Propionibacteriaceae bacterium]|nr:GNAT family N-acetyltransferase [Propionibacteriaceae bacterium]